MSLYLLMISAVRIPVYVSSDTSVTYLKDGQQIFTKDLTTSHQVHYKYNT